MAGWIPGARRLDEWERERGSWVLCEEVRAGVHELRAILAEPSDGANHSELLRGARQALDRAMDVLDPGAHRRNLTASHVTTAQLHLNYARSLWMRTLSPEELRSFLPAMSALVRQHLAVTDEHRIFVERLAREVREAEEAGRPAPLTEGRLVTLVDAVDAARQAALREKLRAESFVRIVRWIAVFLFCTVIVIGVLSALWRTEVPLCFTPAPSPGARGDFSVVCPTGAAPSVPADQLDTRTREVAGWGDYIVVMLIGLVAAGIAATSALRKIRGTSTAFGIPVALAVLKLPTGALTAVLGLLLMRGGFVPGLSALDSPGQIIAWAVVLGYSQELFTKFVDRQGQAVLDGVRGPVAAPPREPAPEPARPKR
ncbi:hypothetical protein [Actinomadura sp. NEAU-AAG7]|uniref:hypothetical protein n=1 Tax=Actinomadura sp. NEAU-AAG7 TaxID=2839640 RepID=UPI001BE3FD47|nr:hypothetical protein [Actinomadura sp. NEAU-AAG7]MBT2213517.1 hypothetical protein [Actinomadura sp. NEAU-AAG7]